MAWGSVILKDVFLQSVSAPVWVAGCVPLLWWSWTGVVAASIFDDKVLGILLLLPGLGTSKNWFLFIIDIIPAPPTCKFKSVFEP